MTYVVSHNPTTGESVVTPYEETSPEVLDEMLSAALTRLSDLRGQTLDERAEMLRTCAAGLEGIGDLLVDVGGAETGLPEARLRSELARTVFQWRFLADVVRDGNLLEATIDHPYDSPMGPLPDLRRQMEPLGVVGVFGASNFPLAFSVPGGDTASALAAGCPVVVKAHPAHPRTSGLCAEAISRSLRSLGLDGAFHLIFGLEAGVRLVEHPHVAAVGFTGSLSAGRALFDRAQARPTPIPFYGELGSVNPVVVTLKAALARAEDIGRGFVSSVTLGAGQFCTKPGVLFVPAGPAGDELVRVATLAMTQWSGATMLSVSLRDRYLEERHVRGAATLAESLAPDTSAGAMGVLLGVRAAELGPRDIDELTRECFGALGIIVRYDTVDERARILDLLEPALTFTVHAEVDDPEGPSLLSYAATRAGRVLVNGWPTGVGVSWSMQHGGPYPAATSAAHTSVGGASLRRWLRPVTYQNVPSPWLPLALRDENPWGVTRRVDGVQQPGARRGTRL